MNKKERIQFIKKTLDKYFLNPSVPLKYSNIFTLLIAVLLSAQSTDKTVNKVTPLLFKKAKSAKKMKELSIKEIENIIRPCGLFVNKAKAIHNLSSIIDDKFNGKVPNTFEELEQLPGVGHKTASVVMAIGYNIPAFPVDTHIFRCAKRWKLTNAKTVKKTEKDLKKAFSEGEWIKRHLQIIYFAQKFCPSRNHIIEKCPICSRIL